MVIATSYVCSSWHFDFITVLIVCCHYTFKFFAQFALILFAVSFQSRYKCSLGLLFSSKSKRKQCQLEYYGL